MAPLLGYWDIRGRAHPLRLILSYTGVKFDEKRYDLTDFSEWFEKDKVQLPLDFPNLPYYIDEDVKLSQTLAILAYIGRKHGLDGSNAIERSTMDLAVEQTRDMFDTMVKIAYPPGNPFCGYQIDNVPEIHEKERKAFAASLPAKLDALSNFLGNKNWIAGDRLTYADFHVYDVLDAVRLLFDPKHLNAFPKLVDYVKRLEGLKGVKEFMASSNIPPMPIFSKFACFGNTTDYKPTE